MLKVNMQSQLQVAQLDYIYLLNIKNKNVVTSPIMLYSSILHSGGNLNSYDINLKI